MTDSVLTTKQQASRFWKLGGLTPKQLAKRVLKEIGHNDLLGRASELAYNFFLGTVPHAAVPGGVIRCLCCQEKRTSESSVLLPWPASPPGSAPTDLKDAP